MTEPTDRPMGELYRLYASDGRLLYVGISFTSALTRMRRHARTQPWWSQVTEIQIERVGRQFLPELERHVIANEQPEFNTQHNSLAVRLRPKPTSRQLRRQARYLVSRDRACRILDLNGIDIDALVKCGLLTPVTIGRAVRYDYEELAKIATNGTPAWYTYDVAPAPSWR